MFSFALAIVYEGLKMVKDIVATKTKQYLNKPKKDKLSLEQEAPVVKYRYIIIIATTTTCESKVAHFLLRYSIGVVELPGLPSKANCGERYIQSLFKWVP